jgi:hypothetical protein
LSVVGSCADDANESPQPAAAAAAAAAVEAPPALGSSDAVERRAERVKVRQFVEGAALTPSAWLNTVQYATFGMQYATFGTTEA